MRLPEIEQSVRVGRVVPDGKICLNASGELAVTKFAVEPGELHLRQRGLGQHEAKHLPTSTKILFTLSMVLLSQANSSAAQSGI